MKTKNGGKIEKYTKSRLHNCSEQLKKDKKR